jgi:hypothetical protein
MSDEEKRDVTAERFRKAHGKLTAPGLAGITLLKRGTADYDELLKTLTPQQGARVAAAVRRSRADTKGGRGER